MLIKEYFLDGLNCAHCAGSIEEKAKQLPNVKESTLNFVTQTLKLNFENDINESDMLTKVKDIVSALEPDVIVSEKSKNENKEKLNIENHEHEHEESTSSDSNIIPRIITGVIIYAVGSIFDFSPVAEIIIFLIAYLVAGYDILIRAFKNIKKGNIFDENTLMVTASIGAFLISEYPEGVAVMLFYQVGEYFQSLAVNKSRKSIADLMDIKPDFANKVTENNEVVTVSPYDIEIDDIILIKPSEKIPLDAVVIEGKSSVDTIALTGESVPRSVRVGDTVLSGTINLNGLLKARVIKNFGESTVSKILDLVENATSKKSETENFITKFAKYYTPIVMASAVIVAFIVPLVLNQSFAIWIHRALTFLVISCPCALVISVPLGFFAGIGASSKKGILVKGSNYLEALNDIDVVVFDKTGTLTKGEFKVVEINNSNGFTKDDVLKYAASAEFYSKHPIATSIKDFYESKENKEKFLFDEKLLSDYEEISGHGISAKIEGKKVYAGNYKLMKKMNIQTSEIETSQTIIYVGIDNKFAGTIIISDELKKDSKEAISKLNELGIGKTVILSGDNKKIAESVRAELNINEVHAELLPTDKVSVFEKIMSNKTDSKKLTAFVGDGINDAPVLARSDVGIAMGGLGSDAAIEAADVVIMTDEPSKLADAIEIAKYTKKIVTQNIIFALGIKLVFLLLGLFGFTTMWAAVFADVGVSLLAILNSMRILQKK